MKKKFMKLFASTAVITGLLLPLAAWAGPKATQPPGPAAQAQAGRQKRGAGEHHPEIQAAIRALERAKNHLQEAAHDFGGHRAEALEAVDNALKQLRQALQYDKK